MAMRVGGTSSIPPKRSYLSIYEDFQPHFELKEEHEAYIIHVHLPGFVKAEVRVTFAQSSRVIRAYGQRLLGNNKWSRFNQTFPVHENSDYDKIHSKFSNGILTITIPKRVVTQIAARPIQEAPPTPSKTATTAAEAKSQKARDELPPKGSSTATLPQKEKDVTSLTTTAGPQKGTSSQPKAQKGQEGISQTANAAAAQDEKQRDKKSAPPSAGPQATAAERKAQKGREGIPLTTTVTAKDEKERGDKNSGHPLGPPKAIAETKAHRDDEAIPKAISAIDNDKRRDEKRVVPLTSPERGIGEHKSHKGQNEIPPNRIDEKRVASAVERGDRKEVENKDKREANEKSAAGLKNAEKVVESTLHKLRETAQTVERSEEAKAMLEVIEKGKRKSRIIGRAVHQEKPKEEDSVAANVMATARECMKKLRNGINDEEKQMLINMGAAVLVLLALGASASYGFSGKAKN